MTVLYKMTDAGEVDQSSSDSDKKASSKICGVCGDKALGYNFNAVTCESCKAFFRRNALKTKEFKCPFDEKCKIDTITRRFCQRCRLKKCFDIGMKKEWILTEEEKKIKKAKIEENRQKKVITKQMLFEIEVEKKDSNRSIFSSTNNFNKPHARVMGIQQQTAELVKSESLSAEDGIILLNDKNEIRESIDDENSQSNNSDASSENNIQLSVKSMKGGEVPMMVTVLAMSAPNIVMNTSSGTIQKVIQNENENLQLITTQPEYTCLSSQIDTAFKQQLEDKDDDIVPKSVLQVAIETEFSKIPIRQHNSNCKELTETERNKLDELITANEILKMPLILGVPDPSLLDVINMTDHAIRRLIKMSKKIYGFKTLCQDDQIALLKGGCTELMILRSVMLYDPEKDCWHGPHGPQSMSIKVDILKEAKGNVYEEHKRFINSFDPIWRMDENVMLILSAITLFTPERPNIVHRDVVKMEQDMYYYLLRRYLETVYSGCEARSIYLKLIKKIQELHILNENHVRVFLDVNPKDVEPLLIEIFDLKH